MAMHVTVDTLLERVKAMAPMRRAYAAEAEAQRRLARPVVDAMLQAGLYSMAHPKAFGGLEVDPLTMFRHAARLRVSQSLRVRRRTDAWGGVRLGLLCLLNTR